MITVVTGTDIEKLKGEFESVINGMNMTGKIPYDIYSELFDTGADCIQKAYELGKAELKESVTKFSKNGLDFLHSIKSNRNCIDCESKMSIQLTKAKEIIKTFLSFAEAFGYSPSMDKFITEAEQFIK